MSTPTSQPDPLTEAEQIAAEQFLRALLVCTNLRDWSETIAQNGVSLLGHVRVSVLTSENSSWRIVAITGASTFVREADAVRRIESFVNQASASFPLPVFVDLASGTKDVSGLSGRDLAYFAASGVRQLRLCPLQSVDSITSACLFIEVFQSSGSYAPPTESIVQLVSSNAERAMRTIQSQHASPFASRWNRGAFFKTRARVLSSVILVTLLLLCLIPADFEVEASGQCFPVYRRRVFAPDDGIVDELLVQGDDAVFSGQPLMRLRNPERDLELSRILGELDTTHARLAAVRALRNSAGREAGNSSSDTIRAADLSGEELQLQQRITTLRAEQTLTEQRLSDLSIHSPIDGVIYQRHLHERLEARPVQRGQLLLELLQPSGPWQIELLIPDDVIGYVTEANRIAASANDDTADSSTGLRVRFTIPSGGGDTLKTRLLRIDSASYLVNGALVCPASAVVGSIPYDGCRPGTAVIARIHCGRRSLGFVWFRELIEFWQRKRFSWSPF